MKMGNLSSPLTFFKRARRLARALGIRHAIHIASREEGSGIARVELRGSPRLAAWVRLGTSDIACLEKVFVDQEYRFPLEFDPALIIDAGANVGFATLFFRRCFPRAQIVAIEPDLDNFSLLKRNCAGLPNTTLVHAALWPTTEKVAIQSSIEGKWASNVRIATEIDIQENLVPSVTIEQILRGSGKGKIDLLKVDIEGAEIDLFSTDHISWLKLVSTIAIELHDRYRPGCAKTFFAAINTRDYLHELRGENVVIRFKD